MNAKLCKRLRHWARGVSVGMPNRRLVAHVVSKDIHGNANKSAINYRATTRRCYRAIKHAVRKGA